MLKFFQTTQMKDASIAFCGSVALLALVSAAPASAQGVPAGLLRLDPVASSDNGRRLVEVDRANAQNRNAFARDRRSRQPAARLRY